MIHPDGYVSGTCVGCGHSPIWHVKGREPLCVRGKLVEREHAEDKVTRVALAIRPTIRGCFDPHSKDHFEMFVDGLCNDIAKQAVAAAEGIKR